MRKALTRAITPEMNTVGLGGLQDKKGTGDLAEQLTKGDWTVAGDGKADEASFRGGKEAVAEEGGGHGKQISSLYFCVTTTTWAQDPCGVLLPR